MPFIARPPSSDDTPKRKQQQNPLKGFGIPIADASIAPELDNKVMEMLDKAKHVLMGKTAEEVATRGKELVIFVADAFELDQSSDAVVTIAGQALSIVTLVNIIGRNKP